MERKTKHQTSMLPGPAVPGCSLVSFHFLWGILCPQAVAYQQRSEQNSFPSDRLSSLRDGDTEALDEETSMTSNLSFYAMNLSRGRKISFILLMEH